MMSLFSLVEQVNTNYHPPIDTIGAERRAGKCYQFSISGAVIVFVTLFFVSRTKIYRFFKAMVHNVVINILKNNKAYTLIRGA